MIDADVQPTLSSYYDIVHPTPCVPGGWPQGLTKLVHDGAISGDIISNTAIDNLDIIVSDDPQCKLPDWILHTPAGLVRIKHALLGLEEAEVYDVVLIDTQGAIGPLQDAAVLAADFLISPVPPEILSAREFLRGTVGELYKRLQPMALLGAPIGPMKAVVYRQSRTADAKAIADVIRQEFMATGGRVTVLDTVIPNAKAYTEAASSRAPVHRHEQTRSGTMQSASQTMHELAWELFPNLKGVMAQEVQHG